MSDHSKTYDFIVGIPRSGTTLLGLRLNKIPGVLSSLENRLLLKVLEDVKQGGDELKYTKKYLEKVLKNQHKFPFTIDPKILLLCQDSEKKSVRNIMESLTENVRYDGVDPKVEIDHVVEKNPGYSLLWERIVESFPDSKFIWMTRDPRGFVNSRLQKVNPQNRINNFYFLSYLWNEYHREFEKLRSKSSCLLIKYEELVTDPTFELNKVIDFFEWDLNIKIEELVREENYSSKLELDDERKQVKYQDLDRSINVGRVEAWKTILSMNQINDIAYLCRDLGAEIGYDLTSEITTLRKLYLRICTLHWKIGAKLFVFLSKRR